MKADDTGDTAARHLRARGLAPRKRLGQNFLRDTSFLTRILDAADIGPSDDVLEIGAGTGVLTRAAAGRSRRLVAIELDDSLFALLQANLGTLDNLELWHGNALDFDPSTAFAGSYKLLGNIPYYITGPLIRRYLELDHRPSVLVFMVQREVADRIVALPGNLSVLGVSVQYYADARIVARVPAGAFYPVPRVDSAILQMLPKRRTPDVSPEAFFSVVKAGFGMRRKQLANSMAAGLKVERGEAQALLEAAGIDATRRAETLSIPEWEHVAMLVSATRPVGKA